MKALVYITILFACSNITGQSLSNTFGGKQIINKNDISLSGVSRLSDIYSLLDDWNAVTIDGYRWQIFSSKTPFDQSQNWILMLDGQRIDLNFFDMKNINFLPISSWKIDSVETISSPMLYKGEYADNGLINITTQKPVKGFSFYGQIFTGNEEGDPGPYKYIDKYNSENIDIIGPDYGVGLELGSGIIDVSLNYKTNIQIYPTPDKPVAYRLKEYGFKHRKILMDALSILIDIPAIVGKPKIIISHTGTGKYGILSGYGSDLIFYTPSFYEVPIDNKFTNIGVSGFFDLNTASSLSYTAKWSLSKMINPEEFSKYMIDWQMTDYYLNAEYRRREINYIYIFGGGIDHYVAAAPYELKDNAIDRYKIYGSLKFVLNKDISQSLEFMLLNNKKKSAVKSSAVNTIKINEPSILESKLSFTNRFFDEYNNIWYWITQDYKLPGNNITVNNNLADNISTNIGLDLTWIYRLSSSAKIQLSGFLNHFYKMIYNERQLKYNPDSKIISAYSILTSGINGNTYGVSIKTEHKLSNSFNHSLFYMYCNETGSNQFFADLWDIFPEHKIRYKAYYTPDDHFGINLAITLLSSSKWCEFELVEKESEGIYESKQKVKLLVDANITKWFWNKRFKINMNFKNILSQKNRYIPLGAYFDFSFFLQAELAVR